MLELMLDALLTVDTAEEYKEELLEEFWDSEDDEFAMIELGVFEIDVPVEVFTDEITETF